MNVYDTREGPVFMKDSIYRVSLRLGEEAFLNGEISEKKSTALVKTIAAFKNILEVSGVKAYKACATSAMREASNNQKIIERIHAETGVQLEIIDGGREADMIFGNHIERIDPDGSHNYLYIDVGGGSTELILMVDGDLIDKRSFNIGTLRIKHNMVNAESWNEMRQWLNKFKKKYKPIKGVGSGGNINHILKHYSRGKNNSLSLDIVDTCYRMLKVIPDRDKETRLGMRQDRADVIVPALEIFRKAMNWVDMEEIYVPKLGLPEGIIAQLYATVSASKDKKAGA
jgi:exopolyphosphatase/guanosine-5'-triphosphate,3'-diphosphate pyrophosphatase